MTLRLYDTASRQVRDFTPLVPGRVSIYLCGATVQAPPHIGHIRSGLNFDILSRWLQHEGFAVSFVRNVTDIDDKILHNAGHEGVPFWVIATRNEAAFTAAYDALGCQRPTVEPRATGHVPEMIVLMRRLIDAGHAYAAGGDVYFDVRSWPTYGSLSGQRVANMLAAPDSDSAAKRDPRDFALWKGAKPGEPAWETPWGSGRPGWHLECSAMAGKYLGTEFDIHGGGVDLIFPHHENEIAQSNAVGDPFARYWLHNGWVTTSGEKMSKSLGNSLLVTEVVKRFRPIELRYYLCGPHYRSHIEYSEGALHEAATAFSRIEGFIRRAAELVGDRIAEKVPPPFAEAMNDDLGTPGALSVVHATMHDGNTALSAGDKQRVADALGELRAMLGVLGLDPLSGPWASSQSGGLHGVVDALIGVVFEQREAARSRKDYAAADRIREQLGTAGIAVEDTPAGPRWSLKSGG